MVVICYLLGCLIIVVVCWLFTWLPGWIRFKNVGLLLGIADCLWFVGLLLLCFSGFRCCGLFGVAFASFGCFCVAGLYYWGS